LKLHLSKSRIAAVGVAGAVLIGGGVSIAAASSDNPATGGADAQQTDGEQNDGQDGGPGSEQEAQDPTFTGTVAAPAETEQADGQEASGGEAQEQAALQKLATISRQQAEQAAVGAVPGTVTESDLGNENGFVVYSVEINGTDGTVTEVTVDAGNATVLAQQVQGADDPADAPDAAEGQNDPED
jgi:uncharacterized membrane protein YkoI